jgi:hypothetical protein
MQRRYQMDQNFTSLDMKIDAFVHSIYALFGECIGAFVG